MSETVPSVSVPASVQIRESRAVPQQPVQRSAPDWRIPRRLLSIFALLWAGLAIAPVSRQDWLLENVLVLAAIAALIATRKRFRFSDGVYACLFVFFALHSIGAHYTYSLVPYDAWWQHLTGSTLNEVLGWERNHYDRVIHFLYGVLMLPAAVELLDRYARARGAWRSVLPVCFIMSHSVIYELMEWVAALMVAPELGEAYLGTQGDAWDAQKDMALATIGSVIAMILLRLKSTLCILRQNRVRAH